MPDHTTLVGAEDTRPAEHHRVSFSGRSGTADLTWAQRQMWDEIQRMLASSPTHPNETQGMEVPAELGLSGEAVVEEIGALVSRHEALHTLYPFDSRGYPTQLLIGDGQLDVEVVRAAPDATDDEVMRIALREERRLLDTPFDHAKDLPFRPVVIVTGDLARAVLLGLSHLAVDFLSGRLLIDELTSLLSSRAAGATRPARAPARQPVDQANFEASPAGDRLRARSLATVRRELSAAPTAVFPVTRAPADPRYWRGAVRSRAAVLALRLLASRYRVSTSVVLLAAVAAIAGRTAGVSSYAVRLVVSSRVATDLKHSIGHISQEVPATIDLSGATFDSVVRSAWSATLRAARSGQYPPEEHDALIASIAEERGAEVELPVFNDLWSLTAQPDPGDTEITPEMVRAAQPESAFDWEESIEHCGVGFLFESFHVLGSADTMRLTLLADTSRLSREAIESFLFGIEDLLVHAVREDGR